MEQALTALRREFHRYPESGWTEFRTTARIIEELKREGIPVAYGREIHAEGKRHGLPKAEVLEACLRHERKTANSCAVEGEVVWATVHTYGELLLERILTKIKEENNAS